MNFFSIRNFIKRKRLKKICTIIVMGHLQLTEFTMFEHHSGYTDREWGLGVEAKIVMLSIIIT